MLFSYSDIYISALAVQPILNCFAHHYQIGSHQIQWAILLHHLGTSFEEQG